MMRNSHPGDLREKDQELVEMYKTYLLKVYRYMYARVHNIELAQDLTSDCMLKVVRNQDFIDQKKNIGSWIFTIAHNTLIDYFRTNKKDLHIELFEEEISDNSNMEKDLETKIETNKVLKAMSKLNEKEKEIVQLTYFAQLEPNEIVQATGKKLTTIRTIRRRALLKLKKIINNEK